MKERLADGFKVKDGNATGRGVPDRPGKRARSGSGLLEYDPTWIRSTHTLAQKHSGQPKYYSGHAGMTWINEKNDSMKKNVGYTDGKPNMTRPESGPIQKNSTYTQPE